MSRKIQYILLLLSFLVVLFSPACKSRKQVLKRSINEYGFDFLYDQMLKNQLKFNTLNSKFSLRYEEGKKVTNLKGQIRIAQDSLIWISCSPALGIEAARVLLSKDSIL